MILIGARLTLTPVGVRSALDGVDFLGGVIHGAVENLLRMRVPEIATALGIGTPNHIKPYAILPPPFGWAAEPRGGELALPFGVALHGTAVRHAEAISLALTDWREVRLAGRVDRVHAVALSIGHPAGLSAQWSPGQPFPDTSSLAPLTTLPARNALVLRFLTPLVLTGSGRPAATAHERPPDLLRIVRALRRRIESANPALFCRLADSDWTSHEEAIRPLEASSARWQEVSWRYGSRTKNAPISFRGHLGSLHFQTSDTAPIPGPIHTLLQWGTWFGVGQRTALGQGMYIVQEGNP